METAAPSLTAVDNAPASESRWDAVLGLPCRLSVELSIEGVTVGQAVKLQPGSVLNSGQEEGAHVPVFVNGQRIALGRFEVVGTRLAIQIVELL